MAAEESGSLMGSLQHAVRTGIPAHLTIGDRGTVSVYPRQQCYVSDIRDWDAVYAASQSYICVVPASWDTPPPDAHPLEELRWRAAYHEACCDMARGPVLPRELVQLTSWPNVTRLPQEMIESVSRVCALLWRKPTVGYLIPRILDLPADRVTAIINVLRMLNHVHVLCSAEGVTASHDVGLAQHQTSGDGVTVQPAAPMVVRLWKRLMGQGE